ncbi:MAG TPA: response regulator, partial [Blastocatellia bacterium]
MDNQEIKVLLVDDDEDDYVMIRRLLSKAARAFALEWIPNFEPALEAIGDNRHQACLVDYRMGEHNGLDLIRNAFEHSSPPPMIMLTGQNDTQVDLEAIKAGATDYLAKSGISSAQLERAIRYAIE